jgi:hypothetical protein
MQNMLIFLFNTLMFRLFTTIPLQSYLIGGTYFEESLYTVPIRTAIETSFLNIFLLVDYNTVCSKSDNSGYLYSYWPNPKSARLCLFKLDFIYTERNKSFTGQKQNNVQFCVSEWKLFKLHWPLCANRINLQQLHRWFVRTHYTVRMLIVMKIFSKLHVYIFRVYHLKQRHEFTISGKLCN